MQATTSIHEKRSYTASKRIFGHKSVSSWLLKSPFGRTFNFDDEKLTRVKIQTKKQIAEHFLADAMFELNRVQTAMESCLYEAETIVNLQNNWTDEGTLRLVKRTAHMMFSAVLAYDPEYKKRHLNLHYFFNKDSTNPRDQLCRYGINLETNKISSGKTWSPGTSQVYPSTMSAKNHKMPSSADDSIMTVEASLPQSFVLGTLINVEGAADLHRHKQIFVAHSLHQPSEPILAMSTSQATKNNHLGIPRIEKIKSKKQTSSGVTIFRTQIIM